MTFLYIVQNGERMFIQLNNTYTTTSIAILEALGNDPDTRFYVRAVAKKAKVSIGATSAVLRALERSGLLTVEEEGNMKFYRFNLLNPVARQWKVLFNITQLKPLSDMLTEETEKIVLFGSAADGKDAQESDIDLFILTQDEKAVRGILQRFQNKYSRPLSPIIMDPSRYARLRREDPSLYENINRGRTLWERE